MNDIYECRNPSCGEPFEVSETGGAMPGSKESEPIDCPHCGQNYGTRRTNGVINTHKLNDAQRAAYQAEKVRGAANT